MKILVAIYEETEKELIDALARLTWYFYEVPKVEFCIATDLDIPNELEPGPDFNISISKTYSIFFPKVSKVGKSFSPTIKFDYVLNFNSSKKIDCSAPKFCVDRHTVKQDSQVFIKLLNILLADSIENCLSITRSNFQRLKLRFPGKEREANLFATGPNLEEAFESGFVESKNGINILCNSAIKHKALLDAIEPHILVFADPIFHFGPSTYSDEFIACYTEFTNRFPDCYVVIPIQYANIFSSRYPKSNNVIFLPTYLLDNPILDLADVAAVKITSNILTYLMFPLATTFAYHLNFYGFDGKQEGSNYFWQHNSNAQFVSSMPVIQRVHPAFFNISYDEYYSKHCSLLEAYVREALKKGCMIQACTTTYIPALRPFLFQKKSLGLTKEVKSLTPMYISILPNMLSEAGHHLSHELEIAKCLPVGTRQILCAHKNFKSNTQGIETYPIFSKTAWEQKNDYDVAIFYLELYNFLISLSNNFGPDTNFSICFYMGDLKHLDVFFRLAEIFRPRNFNFNLNLFYIHDKLLDASGYLKQTVDIERIKRLRSASGTFQNLHVFVDNSKLAAYLKLNFDLDLKVWPHFSSTLVNDETQSGLNQTEDFIIYYPSFIEHARGVHLLIQNLIHTREKLAKAGIRVKIRLSDLSKKNEGIKKIEDSVGLPDFIEYVKGVLSEEEYARNIAESSIIIIPYLKQHFRFRTSAVLLDAAKYNKPVLVCKGTWLANEVESYGTGEAYDENDFNSLWEAISKIRCNYPDYVSKIASYRNSVPINAETYVATLLSKPQTSASSEKHAVVSLLASNFDPLTIVCKPATHTGLVKRALRKSKYLVAGTFLEKPAKNLYSKLKKHL